ncbi:unnamed protein product [Dicrocoelium dendriticum]|nr:unnamed protein product [Dicrocoelium dendriticum]
MTSPTYRSVRLDEDGVTRYIIRSTWLIADGRLVVIPLVSLHQYMDVMRLHKQPKPSDPKLQADFIRRTSEFTFPTIYRKLISRRPRPCYVHQARGCGRGIRWNRFYGYINNTVTVRFVSC